MSDRPASASEPKSPTGACPARPERQQSTIRHRLPARVLHVSLWEQEVMLRSSVLVADEWPMSHCGFPIRVIESHYGMGLGPHELIPPRLLR